MKNSIFGGILGVFWVNIAKSELNLLIELNWRIEREREKGSVMIVIHLWTFCNTVIEREREREKGRERKNRNFGNTVIEILLSKFLPGLVSNVECYRNPIVTILFSFFFILFYFINDRYTQILQYFYNTFTINHRWLVIISSNLILTLRLLF